MKKLHFNWLHTNIGDSFRGTDSLLPHISVPLAILFVHWGWAKKFLKWDESKNYPDYQDDGGRVDSLPQVTLNLSTNELPIPLRAGANCIQLHLYLSSFALSTSPWTFLRKFILTDIQWSHYSTARGSLQNAETLYKMAASFRYRISGRFPHIKHGDCGFIIKIKRFFQKANRLWLRILSCWRYWVFLLLVAAKISLER